MTSPQAGGDTWILSSTICASVIAWNGLDQLLKGFLIARLVTLAKCRGHVVIYVVCRVQTPSESTMLGFRCPLLSVGCMLIRAIHGSSGRNVNHQDSQVIEKGEL